MYMTMTNCAGLFFQREGPGSEPGNSLLCPDEAPRSSVCGVWSGQEVASAVAVASAREQQAVDHRAKQVQVTGNLEPPGQENSRATPLGGMELTGNIRGYSAGRVLRTSGVKNFRLPCGLVR